MKNVIRKYENYEDYINFQKQKTTDPVRRKKWLTDEWALKLDGFEKEFRHLMPSGLLKEDYKALCLGARTGQEVQALVNIGIDAVGIDIVPCEPLVQEGDIHNLKFEDSSFDFVFTNIIDHTIQPQKMISEVERVLRGNGVFFLQMQAGINQDEFTEYVPESPTEIIELFKISECIYADYIYQDRSINAHGMNFEMVFRKKIESSN